MANEKSESEGNQSERGMDFKDPKKGFQKRVGNGQIPAKEVLKFGLERSDNPTEQKDNGEVHVTETDHTIRGKIVNYGTQILRGALFSALIGIPIYTAYSWKSTKNQEDIAQSSLKSAQYASQSAQITFDLAKKAREAKNIAEMGKNVAVKEKEEKVKEAEKATKEKNAAIAHAQKTTREAQITERETILTIKANHELNYPGFNVLIDYIIDGQRSFSAKQLPWKPSLDNKEFVNYATGPTKNISDYLRIKALGDSSYVPKSSIDEFFNGKYDTYRGDILGEDVRTLYKVNAKDGILYGVKSQNGKVIGLDELARQNVTYTGPSKEEIKQKIGKINIPSGWRKMQSYQKK